MSKTTTKNAPKPLEQVPKRLWIQSDDAGGIHLEAALPISLGEAQWRVLEAVELAAVAAKR